MYFKYICCLVKGANYIELFAPHFLHFYFIMMILFIFSPLIFPRSKCLLIIVMDNDLLVLLFTPVGWSYEMINVLLLFFAQKSFNMSWFVVLFRTITLGKYRVKESKYDYKITCSVMDTKNCCFRLTFQGLPCTAWILHLQVWNGYTESGANILIDFAYWIIYFRHFTLFHAPLSLWFMKCDFKVYRD